MGIDAEMFVRTRTKVTKEKLQEWHYQFGSAFHEHLWAFGTHDDKVPTELYLNPIEVYEQDGDDIVPEKGETFLRINPSSRYYGKGYERGDFMTLKSMAEFLELMIPDSEVWYGGDSSGVCASRFGLMERHELLEHFVKHQCRPYQCGWNNLERDGVTVPVCPYCKYPTDRYGWGSRGQQLYAAFSCAGCGWKSVLRNGVVQTGWKLDKDI